MNKRSGNVDLARFIASILIMTHHIFYFGYNNPFSGGWIYVEFFLIITGYFTAKHFDGKNYDNAMKESVIYTIKKFIPFLPYTITFTILINLQYMILNVVSGELNIIGALFALTEKFYTDILLVTESFTHLAIGPLWYLSALFIVFPLFCLLMQLRNRYWIMFTTATYSLLYYGVFGFGIDDLHNPPCTFYRVVAGMCVGAFIYEFVYAFNDYIKNINKWISTIIELLTFILPIVIILKNLDANRFILFCFTVCLAIMLTNLSYTSKIGGGVRYSII